GEGAPVGQHRRHGHAGDVVDENADEAAVHEAHGVAHVGLRGPAHHAPTLTHLDHPVAEQGRPAVAQLLPVGFPLCTHEAVRLERVVVRASLGLPTHRIDRGDEFVGGDAIAHMAGAAEAAGFAAVFVTEHPFPGDAWLAHGGHHALDPLVALSFAAAATT